MTEPDPLTSRDYWSHMHQLQSHQPRRNSWRKSVRHWLTSGFDYHWKSTYTHVLKQYLPRRGKIIEIGCADSHELLALCAHFGLEPFGVEYSEFGYRMAVDNFERQHVDSNGVIYGDFTDREFRYRYGEHFDVVYSAGFIEHFKNPIEIVGYHLELLKPGGQLVILIPNLRALLYHPILSIIGRDILALHNLSIMRRSKFHMLFSNYPLDTHYCNYLGVCNLPLMFRPLARNFVSAKLQIVFDILLTNILRHRDLPNRFTSPYLLYVGTKHGGSNFEQ